MACDLAALWRFAGLPSFSWRDLPALAGVLVQRPFLGGVPAVAVAEPLVDLGVRCRRSGLMRSGRARAVGAGIRDGGEGAEQLGHLDAEDVGEDERPVDGDRLAGVLDLRVEGPAQPGLPGH